MKKMMLILMLLLCSLTPMQANTKERVTFKKCTDGDTAHVLRKGKDITVRFLAIDAPEYTKEKEPYGKEASAFVCDILTSANKIELEYDDGSDKTDKYGRTLAWVYADDVLIQKELIRQGLAEVAYLYGDYAYTKELQDLENLAKKEKLNIWSTKETTKQTWFSYFSMGGGIILIVVGTVFVKGKKGKQLVKQGRKHLKK